MKTDQFLKMPKVELHCHLDGSVGVGTLREIYRENGEELPFNDVELARKIMAPTKCRDLGEYLSCFRLVTAGLHTRRALRLALQETVRQAAIENVLYQEIRLSPKHLATPEFSMEAVVEALVLEKQSVEDMYQVGVGLILCMMRGQSREVNEEILRLAAKYRKAGVVAVDLAGNEMKYPTKDYQQLFQKATELGLPFTIHAGETGIVENVATALAFGAHRIGHGLASVKDVQVLEMLVEKDVLLELCPVCNIQTGAAPSWHEYPIPEFDKRGIKYSLNTDNRVVSNTSMTRELQTIHQNVRPISLVKAQQLLETSIDFLFLEEPKKVMLKQQAVQAFKEMT